MEGFALYAHARDTSIIENDCVRAICTGVPYEGLDAAVGTGLIRPEQIDVLGLVDGDVVATAGVVHGTRAAEVQHIATQRSHRRRGIGTAMTVAALDLVRRQGGRHAVLTASPDGFGIYERLGFETVATVRRLRGRGRDGS